MAISSASTRIFKAEDPVMETDLQLLAKVNTYQQDKFDQGEKSLQDEVNNWSMLANVAKPQDKEYINQKLNATVSKIRNMGGVNLADPNNVNTLKSLGYNMYGDDNVMNPVITSRKMNQLAQDISAKTNGKNAKDYDSVYGEFLQNQYSDWLNDGKQGTSFNGPTSLPQGSFDGYTKKINDYVSKLKPDSNDAPQDSKDAALNYYQVGDKFIKKERINAAIDANTSSQDRDILSAHAWKSTRGVADADLIHLQASDYDSKIKDMQDNVNTLQYQKSLTGDFKQKQLFGSQIEQYNNAIKATTDKKSGLLSQGPTLDKDSRQQLADNLFYNSFKDQFSASAAYDQKKVELKSNTAAIENLRMAKEDFWHVKNYDFLIQKDKEEQASKKIEQDLKKRDIDLKEEALFMKMYGISSGAYGPLNGPAQKAPLSLVTDLGKEGNIKLDNSTITQATANYTSAAGNFYKQGYNYLMSKDPTIYGNYLTQDADGDWVPKDVGGKSEKIVNKALQSFVQMYGNIANMSLKEREGLKFDDDSQELFKKSKDLEEAGLYKDQINDITAEVFTHAGKDDPNTKNINVYFGKGSKFGDHVAITYSKLKEMIDKNDPLLDEWRKTANIDIPSYGGGSFSPGGNSTSYNGVSTAINTVKDYYNDPAIDKGWDEVSKRVNPYGRVVSLPKLKNGKLPDEQAKILSDAITDSGIKADVNLDDIDIAKAWAVYDPKTLEAKYMAQVRIRKASKGKDTKLDKGDKYTIVDLTKDVNAQYENGGGWISNLYSPDNAAVVYGLALQNQGKTPFDPKTNYEGALQTHGELTHKYQIVAVKDPKTKGTTGYKVFVAIPLGKDGSGNPKFQTIPVPNFHSDPSGATTTFPASFDGVRVYMEGAFQDTASTKDFYQRMGIPWNE